MPIKICTLYRLFYKIFKKIDFFYSMHNIMYGIQKILNNVHLLLVVDFQRVHSFDFDPILLRPNPKELGAKELNFLK